MTRASFSDMLRKQLGRFLKLCKLRRNSHKTDVFVEVLVLNVMVPKRLTRKDLLHISIGSLLFIVIGFIIIYGIILHQVDRKMHIARNQFLAQEEELYNIRSRHTKRVKFKVRRPDFNPEDNDPVFRVPLWNPSDYDYDVTDMPECVSDAKFLILITSAPKNIDRRSTIRKTWCNPYASEHSKNSWQCVFLVGASEDESTIRAISLEKSHYHDILHGSYKDSYRNLTLKVFNSFTWSKNHCPLPYVIKTDDDCFVNTKLLYSFLTTHNQRTTNLYAGNVFMEASNRAVIRGDSSKWRVSKEVYEPDHYPPYASGTGYIMSSDVISRLADECRYHKPIPVEDGYTGVVIHALGLTPTPSARFMPYSSGLSICNYLYMFVAHNVEPERQVDMHDNMLSAKRKCAGDEEVKTWF